MLQNYILYFKFEVADNMTMLLGYNEPNRPDQVNCPPKETARYYKELNERYPDKIMISPATGGADTDWFDEFYEECLIIGCRIDYLATHLYSGSPQERIEQLKAYSERYIANNYTV